MRYIWIWCFISFLLTSCDTMEDNPSVYGLWWHTGTAERGDLYLYVQDSTLTFFFSEISMSCFDIQDKKIERYEDDMLIFDTTQRIILPGQDPDEAVVIPGEARYEFRVLSDTLIYRLLPDGFKNEYVRSDLSVSDLMPECECDMELSPEVCAL